MWEEEPELFLNNLPLLPLAPLTRTNSPQGLLSQIANNLAKIADRETKQDIAAYTEILAGLQFGKDFIRQLLSEDIMQESVIYQSNGATQQMLENVGFPNVNPTYPISDSDNL